MVLADDHYEPATPASRAVRHLPEELRSATFDVGRARRSYLRRVLTNRELGVFLAAYLIYIAARWTFIGNLALAMHNARWVIDFERSTHTAVERSVQRAVDVGPATWVLSNLYLFAQLAAPALVLLFVHRRSPRVYRRLRDTMLASWLLDIPVFAAFPVVPPRLARIGLADTVSHQAAIALTGHSTIFYNPYAAVPSLHVGFAFSIGLALWASLRGRITRVLALSWGPLVTLAVIATGNHYVFDVVTGLFTSAFGYAVSRAVAKAAVRARRWRGQPPAALAKVGRSRE